MKLISIALGLLLLSAPAFAGLPPTTAKGQLDTAAKTTFNFQVPNKQATSVTGATLLETGNKNILANPSFEAVVNGPITGWAQTGIVSANVETTVVFDGKSSIDLSSPNQALDFHQDSTLYQAQFADGPQGLAMMRVKTTCTDAPIYVCPRTAGAYPSQKTSGCVQVQPTGKWKLYKIPFLLGGTSNGIGITSNGSAITCDTYIDDAFVGAVDLKQDVDQSRIAGSAYFPGTVSCSWSRTSTTQGPFPATTACPGPTIEYSSMGSWQTTDSDLPRVTVNNLPSGVYKASFYFSNTAASGQGPTFSINDGTTSCTSSIGSESGSYSGVVITCTFNYTSSGDRVFELYVSTATGTVTIDNTLGTGYKRNTKFILEYFGKGSVYSTTNADTDWAACNFSTLAWQGLGTVTSNLQCKRQGGDLLVFGRVTTGTVAASEGRIPLPLWNGVQLNTKNSTVITALSQVGTILRGASAVTSHGGFVLAEPSVPYLTITDAGVLSSVSITPLSKANGSNAFASSEVFAIEARIPIDTWDNSNIIIGQFNGLESCANSAQCENTYVADVSAAGVVSGEEIDFINGNCTLTTNTFACTYNSGQFTQAPMCTISVGTGATQSQKLSETASGFSYTLYNSTGSPQNMAVSLSCRKRGGDYVTKTARAVASDANLKSVGAIGVDVQLAVFGSGTNCATVCSTGNCTICRQVGSKITSISFSSTGFYNINGIDGTKYSCFGSGANASGFVNLFGDIGNSTSSFVRVQAGITSTNQNVSGATVTCIGIP